MKKMIFLLAFLLILLPSVSALDIIYNDSTEYSSASQVLVKLKTYYPNNFSYTHNVTLQFHGTGGHRADVMVACFYEDGTSSNQTTNTLSGVYVDSYGLCLSPTKKNVEIEIWVQGFNGGSVFLRNQFGYGDRYHIQTDLDSPIDTASSKENTIEFNSTINPSEITNLTNATIYVWNSTGGLYNHTTNIVTGNLSNSTSWKIYNFSYQTYSWNVLGCGVNSTGSNNWCEWAISNYSFTFGFDENENSYNANAYDTSRQFFVLNMTPEAGTSFVSANLIYNGTTYYSTSTESGDDYIFNASLDIPVVTISSTKQLYWQVFIVDADGGQVTLNTSTKSQTVAPSTFTQCGTVEHAVNYTIYDEENNTLLTSDFDATFEWKLYEYGTVTKNNSFGLAGADNYQFCINNNETYYTVASITVDSDGYSERHLTLADERYNNETTFRPIYLLHESKGTNVAIQVKDEGLKPLQNYLVRITRSQPATSNEVIVEEDLTNVFGQVRARLVENTVDYNFYIYNESKDLVKSFLDTNIICTSTICIIPLVVTTDETAFDRFQDITWGSYSFTFNDTSNKFLFSWTDTSGNDPSFRLLVERVEFDGTTTVCNNVSSALSGSLSCLVGNTTASYRAQIFRTVSNKETRIDILTAKVGTLEDTYGLEGLMWSFVLLFTCLATGIFSPVVGVGLYVLGFIFLGATGVIYINPAIAIAQIVIAVLFMWAVRT